MILALWLKGSHFLVSNYELSFRVDYIFTVATCNCCSVALYVSVL